MAEIDCNLNLYKTPSNEILWHRKEFYSLQRKKNEQTNSWSIRVKCCFDRCEFPPLISHEYLLIDKFVSDLNDNAKEFVQGVDTWTLKELREYFIDCNIVTDQRIKINILIENTADQQNQQIPSSLADEVQIF